MASGISFTSDSAIKSGQTFDARNLAGKSVIVTGGASGLGEAFLRAFAAAGAFVTFGDVADDRGQALQQELGSDKVAFVHCDVLNWAEQLTLFKTAIARSPAKCIDVVCANAGIGTSDDIYPAEDDAGDDPVEPELKTLKVNLIGMIYTAKLAMHYLPRQPQDNDRDRCFIMTASVAGYLDQPRAAAYQTSKWGTRGLFRSLRNTMPAKGLRIGIIAPWWVRTRIVPEQAQKMLDSSNVEWALAEDAASAVLHIAADKSVNGRCLHIIPRSYDPRGYADLELDNSITGSGWETALQALGLKKQ